MPNILYLSIEILFLLSVTYLGFIAFIRLESVSISKKKIHIRCQKIDINTESLVCSGINKDGKFNGESPIIRLNLKKIFPKGQVGRAFDFMGYQYSRLNDQPFSSFLKFETSFLNRKYSDVYLPPSYHFEDYIENVVMLN